MAEINSVLITGANRGIGFEFVEQFLTNPLLKTNIVIATCRSPEKATALKELAKKHSNLHILELDVTEFDTYDNFVEKVQIVVGLKGLTLLINNAGVVPPGIRGLIDVEVEDVIRFLKTNTIAPLMLTKALYPLLKLSATVNAVCYHNELSIQRAAVINITSGLGSIQKANSDWSAFYGYCESKAALNMSTKLLSFELGEDGILVESIHPGIVFTGQTKAYNSPAEISTNTSVTGMLKVMLNMREKNMDGFWVYDGQTFPF